MDNKTLKTFKTVARKNFDGSDALFSACWRKYLGYLNGSIDDPKEQSDVDGWLNTIASEKVNDPKSRFFIHG